MLMKHACNEIDRLCIGTVLAGLDSVCSTVYVCVKQQALIKVQVG